MATEIIYYFLLDKLQNNKKNCVLFSDLLQVTLCFMEKKVSLF